MKVQKDVKPKNSDSESESGIKTMTISYKEKTLSSGPASEEEEKTLAR